MPSRAIRAAFDAPAAPIDATPLALEDSPPDRGSAPLGTHLPGARIGSERAFVTRIDK